MAWLGRRTQKSLGIGLLALFAWGGAAWGQAVIIAIPPSNLNPGEKSEGFLGFGCYDIHTLLFINCHVTVKLDSLDPAAMIPPFFGGHLGHAPQPVGTVRDSNGTGPGGDFVEGDTLKGFSVVYTAPEGAGQIQVTNRLVPPPSYICLSEPDGTGACKHVRRINVGIQLSELPPDPFYRVIRQDRVRHPNGTSATSRTIMKLKTLALLYHHLTDQKTLSINDISLPQGGLFDFRRDWSAPHKTHRRGAQVDINRAPLDPNGNPLLPIDCAVDYELQAAVLWLANGTNRPRLVCELNGEPDPDGPFKHINLE